MQHGYVWINSALQVKEIQNQPCAKHIVFFQKIRAALCKDSPARYDRKRRIASFNSVTFSQIYILACAKQNTLTDRIGFVNGWIYQQNNWKSELKR